MSNFVPATTSIRRSRVANIDSDRLSRRRSHVVGLIDNANKVFERRADFIARVAELAAIERELMRRDLLADPYLSGY